MTNTEWKEYTVQELIDLDMLEPPLDGNHGEKHPKSTDYVSEGIPFVMANDLTNGSVDLKNCYFITQEQADSLDKGFAKPGDVLLTHKATLGRTAIVPDTYPMIVLTPQVTYYRCKKGIHNKYLKYYFDSPSFQQLFQNWAGSGSTRLYLGITAQRKLPIVLPPLAEQQRIAKILSSLDEKIELNNAINRNLEEQAQAIFKSWFIDFEPFGGEMPEDWAIGKLSDIADITMGQSPDGKSYNENGDGVVFYQGRAEFGWRFPTRRLFTAAPSRMAKKYDTLMSVRAPVGDLNIANEDCCIGRGLAAIHSKNNHQSFVHYTIIALKPKLDMYNGEGTVFGCINRDSLSNMEVIIPCKQDLDKFESLISILDAEIFNYSEENHRLNILRNDLLRNLLE